MQVPSGLNKPGPIEIAGTRKATIASREWVELRGHGVFNFDRIIEFGSEPSGCLSEPEVTGFTREAMVATRTNQNPIREMHDGNDEDN